MAFTIEQQYSRDIDWYFKDGNSSFIHVASAGGLLPKVIAENDDLIDILYSQIMELPTQFEVIVNPILGRIVTFETEEARELYLIDFIEMAKRGFISIDKTNLGNFEDKFYHIVAFPKKGVIIDLLYSFSVDFISSKKIIETSMNNSFDLFEYFEE